MMERIDISDEPIKTPKEDKYGFAESAKELAKKIIKLNTKGSTTISIEESWGNGKTSYCNLVKYYLKSDRKRKNIEIIDFIPFVFDTDNQLIDEFVDLLIDRASNNDINKKSKYKIQKYFKTYFSETKLDFPYNIFNLFLNREKDFNQRKDEINKIIEKTGKKYIIFIDDLDRIIEKEKIISILKLIKYIADLNQIVFIINIDRDHINKVLMENDGAYLDKFIQHREIVPININKAFVDYFEENLKLNNLNEIFKYFNNLRNINFYNKFKELYFDEKYHDEIFFLILFYLIYEKNLSSIKIYNIVKSIKLEKENQDETLKNIYDFLKKRSKDEKSLSNENYIGNYILYNIKDKNFVNKKFVENSLNNLSKNSYYNFLRDNFIKNKRNRKYFANYLNILFKIIDINNFKNTYFQINLYRNKLCKTIKSIERDIEKENFDNKNDIKKLIDMILNQIPDSKGGN